MTKLAAHTPATLADELGTDPRTVRKFLRASGTKVGKGARHSIPADARSMKSLRAAYAKWDEARNSAKLDNSPAEVETAE